MEAFITWLRELLSDFDLSLSENFFSYIVQYTRIILPILAVWVLFRCMRSLLRENYESEIWGYFIFPDETRIPMRHWECTIGRSSSSDIILSDEEVSRSHAVVLRDDDGNFAVYDLNSKGGVRVNGLSVSPQGAKLEDGDLISIAGVIIEFIALTEEEQAAVGVSRTVPGKIINPGATFFILTVFMAVIALQHTISADAQYSLSIALSFGTLCAMMWCYYLVMRSMRRMGFELEAIAFLLCTLGLSVVATSVPSDMTKQILLLSAGIMLYLVLGFWQRDLGRAKSMRWPAGVFAVVLLAVNLLIGQETFGARNWISVFGFQFQPSELVKILYIYAGTATLDRLYMGRNLFLYIAFSAVCVGALALMGDFGTALIFFATFLVISYMRSGNLATIFLAVTGAGLGGMLMFTIKPHIAQRFSTWGHIWEFANAEGYQQTRALSAAASGGLFGQGAGMGWMNQIVAADTDLVFSILCEELGLIIAVIAVIAILIMAAFAVHSAARGRSAFYVIAACASASLLMIQMALNVFGCLDILPFTGVTFPFVSKGGSSLIACWGLLAFIKAADTRKNASFTIKILSRRKLSEILDAEVESFDEE